MRVLGTAGHVDHGKSTLVQALTGIHPDRLREEQERQMTIDLGFAWMTLPGGEEVGIIDVPGHRDFIENMLAGVGGIDAALLVVAADEGVMPQTREHLAILDLLDIEHLVVALSKVDQVADEAWVDLVRDDVIQLLRTMSPVEAPIIPISSVTGAGLSKLVEALERVLRDSPPRRDLNRPRLPIDRAFTIAGFGTVVTGTLVDGKLDVGKEVEILPSGLQGRIRGLQTHKTKVDQAIPGSRVAANIIGVEVRELSRGDVVCEPRTYRPTSLIDVRFRLLADVEGPVRHNQEVKLFLGSAQRMAMVRVLGQEEVKPGEDAWLQLVLDKPLVAARGDHFILRRPSPGATLGGGRVADPHPSRRHRRKDRRLLSRLESYLQGTADQILIQSLASEEPMTLRQAAERAGIELGEAQKAAAELRQEGALVVLGGPGHQVSLESVVMALGSWELLEDRIRVVLEAYHRQYPFRLGMPREELKSRMGLGAKAFSAVYQAMTAGDHLVEQGARVRLPEHEVILGPSERQRVDSLMRRFEASPFSPPSVKECLEALGDELMSYMLESGRLVKVSAEIVFEADAYQRMVARVREALKRNSTLSVAEVRDMFQTSRKYGLALMEHLDAEGVTVREGDVRRLS